MNLTSRCTSLVPSTLVPSTGRWILATLVGAALLLGGVGCDLGELVSKPYDGPLYSWVQDGHQMTFDFHPVSDTLVRDDGFRYDDTEGALIVDIRRHPADEHRFRFSVGSSWEVLTQPLYSGLEELAVERTADGLKAVTCKKCGCGAFFFQMMSFVRVPADPTLGASYPQYICEGEVTETLRVEAVGRAVKVPAGTFDTFVLYSPSDSRREYWSEAEGLIKVEQYEPDGDLLGVYELNSKNF